MRLMILIIILAMLSIVVLVGPVRKMPGAELNPKGRPSQTPRICRFPVRDVTIQHALVCSFITSAEYQNRFSSVVTHANSECSEH